MLRAFCNPVREALQGNVEFTVAARHPDKEYDERYGVRTVQNLEYARREDAAGRWLRGLNPDDSSGYLGFVEAIAQSDLVVLGPGQFLVETGTAGLLKGALGQALAVIAAARMTQTPVYGLALACEDLESNWAKLAIQTALDGMAKVTFRDPQSIANLNRAGIRLPDHSVHGDLALAGEPAPRDMAEALFAEERIPGRKGPRLAVALRNIYWQGLDMEAHRRKIARVMELWLAEPHRDIVMVPQNVYDIDGDRDDDRAEAERTLALLSPHLRQRVHAISGKHDVAATEAVYGQSDVALCARLHGAVFSCKQGTPPVMLTFMDKARGFFRRLDEEACLVPLDASVEDIYQKLESFLAKRELASQSILDSVKRNRTTALQYAADAVSLLDELPGERKTWARGLFG